MQINDRYLFPELRLNKLKSSARLWAARYEFISRIVLYKDFDSFDSENSKYVIILEVPDIEEGDILCDEYVEFMNNRDSLELLGENFTEEICEASKDPLETLNEKISFRDKWSHFVKHPDKPLPGQLIEEGTRWELFSRIHNPSKPSRTLPQSSLDYFKGLDLKYLKEFAKNRWVNKLSEFPIENIKLYKYLGEDPEEKHIDYAVIFKMSPEVQGSDDLKNKFRKLQEAMGFAEGESYHDAEVDVYLDFLGINDGFIKAYEEKPQGDYMRQWAFIPIISNEPMPKGIMVDEPFIKLVGYSRAKDNATPLILDDEWQKKSSSETEKKLEPVKKDVFPCPPGTKWEDITIILVADDTVRIKTPHGKGRYTYHQLGLNDKRSADQPTMLWELLKLFARFTGLIQSENAKYNPKLPDTAKRLNKHFKNLFGIDESIYQAHYRKEDAYRTKINFEDETHNSQE